MLQMKCNNCEKKIISPLLAEIEQIDCPHCQQRVPVRDVIISAQGYSYHRNDLVKRLFRYKTLITEVSKELELMEKSPEASAESKNSLRRFLATLEEMMAGARDNLRIDFEWPPATNYQAGRATSTGCLINLSMEGACIEIDEDSPLPKKKSAITLSFLLPHDQGRISLNGTVVWVKKKTKQFVQQIQVGVSFTPLDEQVQKALWSVIEKKAAQH